MNIIKYPVRDSWEEIVKRPHLDVSQLNTTVCEVLKDVKENGDEAVIRYEQKFDHVHLDQLTVTDVEKEEAIRCCSKELIDSLKLAHRNIARFHEVQQFSGKKIETAKGVTCWQKSVPIEKVGLYIPGGTAPLFSTVLMLATPAVIAGCKEIILCTPPNHEGKVNPAILAAAQIAGVSHIYKAGGVQAIGAMAYGTDSIPKVYKIFGPGNQYVMAAKQQVSLHDVAIDMPAGPSEVCVIADKDSDPVFVAADLLSQAEHGIDSQVMLITDSETILGEIQQQVSVQLARLPRKEIASQALDNSHFILVHDLDEAIDLSNCYAPEHLILAVNDYTRLAQKVVNAGSVFLGKYACESAGDYASGTNHTLPTHRYALAYNGVNLDSYNRKITFQHLDEQGIESIGNAVVCMAENEQLEAHANAMRLRIRSIKER
ncbi:MAG: histidinol dehydrogenase [Prevotella sp.]|jgi:histidinol dehydrogenase|nr:histidinol dehydrogenase [Prevotella sp.]MCH4182137.1 histidinol dehydrogenase [Prevotella sp.]MCH4212566.1 histidinol dehydrogenase [Prevotella sp.]